MALSDIRVSYGWRMLNLGYEPNMGGQNQTNVPSKLPGIPGPSTAMAL